jgi:DNA-binding response OmpR family regulator
MSTLVPRISRERLVRELADPALRLIRLTAPAGFGKTTVARALLERAGSRAVCDLAIAADPAGVARGIVEAASADFSSERRAALSQDFLAFGNDEEAWRRCAERILADAEQPLTIAFENSETLAGRHPLIDVVERCLVTASRAVRAVVCARVDPGLRLGRFAGPDATRLVGPDELKFDRAEIARVFGALRLSAAKLQQIEAFTRGWPIIVIMLFMLAKRGRLDAYLSAEADVADLYGYVASEVYRFLEDSERRVLDALAAIPDATTSDLAALFGDGHAAALAKLERDTPFVSRVADRIDVHPAMRQMLVHRGDPDAVLARLYVAVDRSDGGLRAARVALHRGRPDDAARALTKLEGGYILTTPTPELNALLSELPSDVTVRYPMIWSVSTIARAFVLDPVTWIEEGERVMSALGPEDPPMVHGGVVNSLANAYLNRGRFAECESMLRRFAAEAGPELAPLAAAIRDFWLMARDAYAGREIDLTLVAEGGRFAPFMAAPGTRALTEYDVVARQHRILGERASERAVLARAADVARSTKIPLVQGIILMDASFGAWLAGEDALHVRYLAELETVVTPAVELGLRHYIDCARGAESRARFGTEKMKCRANAFVIAASLARGEDRRRCALEAVAAADHSAQPFAQIIARVARAVIEPSLRDGLLLEAAELAATTCSEPLRLAVAAVREGDATGTMLEALVHRFAPARAIAKAPTARLRIELAEGAVLVGDRQISLTDRELELLTLLALAGRPLDAEAVGRRIWPGFDGARAAASLKVYANRLRTKLGHPDAISSDRRGYRLNLPHEIELDQHAGASNLLARRLQKWDWLQGELSKLTLKAAPAALPATP